MSPTKYNVKNTFAESDRPKSTQEWRSVVVEVKNILDCISNFTKFLNRNQF